MVQGIAQNFATLIVARVIAGSCGGALQNAIDGMVADIWGEDERKKSFCLSVFILALTGGVTIGPVMGGLIIRSLSWRWYVLGSVDIDFFQIADIWTGSRTFN